MLIQQFKREQIRVHDIEYWFSSKKASKSLIQDLMKHYAQTKDITCQISLRILAKELAESRSKLAGKKVSMSHDKMQSDPLNESMAKSQLIALFFEQLGRRAVVPFDEAAERLFYISKATAEAKLRNGRYPGLKVMQLEPGNRKSRTLVSVTDLADYFILKKEVVVLDRETAA